MLNKLILLDSYLSDDITSTDTVRD